MGLLTVALVACVAAVASGDSGLPYIGSRRSAASHRGRVLRHLEDAFPVLPFEEDSFSFAGPVRGLGYVNHTHNVVFRNDTLSLDLWTEVLHKASCVPLPDNSAACRRHQTEHPMGGRGTDGDEMVEGLVGGGKCRPGVALRLDRLDAIPAAVLRSFQRHLALSRVVIFGLDALEALPEDASGQACRAALLHGGLSPSFSIGRSRVDTTTTMHITLPRAGLLEAFAAASWHHHVDPDLPSALAKRGLTLEPSSGISETEIATRRQLEKFTLLAMRANWEGDAETGGVVNPDIPLVSFLGGNVGLSCVDCYAYAFVELEVKVGFCANIDVGILLLRVKAKIDFGCTEDDLLRENRNKVSLHVLIRLEAQAKANADLRLGTRAKDGGYELSYQKDVPRKPLLPLKKIATLRFALLGLPVSIDLGFGIDFRAGAWGKLEAAFRTGATAQGKYVAQYQFNSRARDNGWTRTWEASAEKRPLTFEITTASASAFAELLPTFAVSLYGIFPVNASLAVRVQADLDHRTPDMVECDVPYCGTGGNGFPVYVTGQLRLVIANGDLRVKDLVGLLPGLGKVASSLVSEGMRLISEGEPVNRPLTSRLKLLGFCLPIPRQWSSGPALFWSAGGQAGTSPSAFPSNKRLLAGTGPQISFLPAAAAEGRQLQVSTSPTVTSSRTATASASNTASFTPSASPAWGTLVLPLTVAPVGTDPARETFKLPKGVGIMRSFTVADSTAGFYFGFESDYDSCCGFLCTGSGQPYITVSFWVGPPYLLGTLTQLSPVYTFTIRPESSSRITFDISQGSNLPVYARKQEQGFGSGPSSYWVWIYNEKNSCPEANGRLYLQYQTAPSPSSSSTASTSMTASNTPSSTATESPTASPTITGSITGSSSVAPSISSTPTASLSSGASASKTASESASGTAPPSISLSSTATSTATATRSISQSASISYSGTGSQTGSATSTVSISYTPTATLTATPSPTGTTSNTPTTPPFAMPSCDRKVIIVDESAMVEKVSLITQIKTQVKAQLGVLVTDKLQGVVDKLPEAVKTAAAAMAGVEPSELAAAVVSKAGLSGGRMVRRLGDTLLIDVVYSTEATQNITLQGSDPNAIDAGGAQDLDDAKYFMSLAGNTTAALLKGGVEGTLPDDQKPQVDCASLKDDPDMLQLFCSVPTAGGSRRVQSTGMAPLSFSSVIAASLTKQGMGVAAASIAVQTTTFTVASAPVVQTTTIPVAVVSSNGSVVRRIAPATGSPAVSSESGLSPGAVAAIEVGALLVGGAAVLAAVLVVRKRRREREELEQRAQARSSTTVVSNPITVRSRARMSEVVAIPGVIAVAGNAPGSSPNPLPLSSVAQAEAQIKRGSVAINPRELGRSRRSNAAVVKSSSSRCPLPDLTGDAAPSVGPNASRTSWAPQQPTGVYSSELALDSRKLPPESQEADGGSQGTDASRPPMGVMTIRRPSNGK